MLAGAGAILMVVGAVVSVVSVWAFFRISKKLGGMSPWMQFVPIANMFYYFQLTGLSWKFLLLLLVIMVLGAVSGWLSLLGTMVFFGWCQMLVAERCGQNKWFGLLLFVPIVNLWVLWKMGTPTKAAAGAQDASALSGIERIKNMPAAEVAKASSGMPGGAAEPAAVAPSVELSAYEQQQVAWIRQCVAGGFEKSQLQQTLAEQSQVPPEQFEKLWAVAQV